ncbi:MAG: response regulator transcription factor [Myxococcaceae bacterium]
MKPFPGGIIRMDTTTSSAIRVAIIEDHPFMREALVQLLDSSGTRVVSQHDDASNFLGSLESAPADVAIVDLTLRGGDGLSVVSALQQFHPEVRSLVYTASVDPGIAEQCFRAGARGFLHKSSVAGNTIIQAVQAVAQGQNVFPTDFVASMFESSAQRPQAANKLRDLSAREREILAHIGEGADNLKIASMLGISERTVKAHVSNLYRKLAQENRTQMALLARQLGVRPVVQPPQQQVQP